MKAIIYFLIFASLSFSSHSLIKMKTAGKVKHTVLVLPSYDLIANEGISPNMHQYLEIAIAKDTNVVLIKFPFKKMMGVRYQNVFDKRYCKPILAKQKADIIIMLKLEPGTMNGNMGTDKWNCSIRIYYVLTGRQIDSKLLFKDLTTAEINAKLTADYTVLGAEIK